MNNLPINIATVGNIKDSYQADSVVYTVDYPVISYALCALRVSFKKLLRLREVSRLRVSAMARSIMSSLKRALCINPVRMAFCSAFGNARNAVKKISALACTIVISESPFQLLLSTKVYYRINPLSNSTLRSLWAEFEPAEGGLK